MKENRNRLHIILYSRKTAVKECLLLLNREVEEGDQLESGRRGILRWEDNIPQNSYPIEMQYQSQVQLKYPASHTWQDTNAVIRDILFDASIYGQYKVKSYYWIYFNSMWFYIYTTT